MAFVACSMVKYIYTYISHIYIYILAVTRGILIHILLLTQGTRRNGKK